MWQTFDVHQQYLIFVCTFNGELNYMLNMHISLGLKQVGNARALSRFWFRRDNSLFSTINVFYPKAKIFHFLPFLDMHSSTPEPTHVRCF